MDSGGPPRLVVLHNYSSRQCVPCTAFLHEPPEDKFFCFSDENISALLVFLATSTRILEASRATGAARLKFSLVLSCVARTRLEQEKGTGIGCVITLFFPARHGYERREDDDAISF